MRIFGLWVLFSFSFLGQLHSSPLDCVSAIKKVVPYMYIEEAVILCSDAKSNAPSDCYQAIKKIVPNMYRSEAVILCSGASDNSPVDCYKDTKEKHPSWYRQYAVMLCSKKGIGYSILERGHKNLMGH